MSNLLLALVGSLATLASQGAEARSVVHSGIPNTTGGVFLSCENPHRHLLISRGSDRTEVSQITGSGIAWTVDLPAMEYEYDQFHASPGGDAAVVTTGRAPGQSWLVVAGDAIRIEEGHVASADFESGRVAIASYLPGYEGSDPEVVVAVHDLEGGGRVGGVSVSHPIEQTVDRDFHVRLTADGLHVYYVLAQRGAVPARVEIRDVGTGREAPQRSSLVGHGEIFDLTLLSATEGYLAAQEGLFEIRGGVTRRISLPEGMGRAWRVIELEVPGHQFVVGTEGWAVRNWNTGRWVAGGRGGYARVIPTMDGWTLVEQSARRRSVVDYRLRGTRAEIVRELSGSGVPRDYTRLACANAFGAMRYDRGTFRWVPTDPRE